MSEAQSLAAHHWTAHRQLVSPGPGWQQSPDTQKLVTARHDSFPRHAAERAEASVWTCGAAPAWCPGCQSTNMKSKFDSGSRGRGTDRPGCGNHPWQSLSWLHLAVPRGQPGTPSSDIITSSHTHSTPEAELSQPLKGGDISSTFL